MPKVPLNTNQAWGAWPGLLSLVCVAAASGHTERGVNEKGPAINRGLHQIQNSGFLSSASLCTFSCFLPGVHRGRAGGLGGKVGSAGEEFEDNEDGVLS